jgi:hypothetical protein
MSLGNWGATDAEVHRPMTGDGFVAHPNYRTTMATTVAAPPEDIWPWLVQMGYRRGGLYSYDWLDRLFGYLDRPSATRILPEYQHLEPGDEIPLGRGPAFPVKAVDPERTLVLGGESDEFGWVWELALVPVDARRTRLISRNTARVPPTFGARAFMLLLRPAAFIMTRRMLIGLRQRAEKLASMRTSVDCAA